MLCKRLLLLILLITSCTKAFSAVFVVTSNADSGPGTLREALTMAAANGSATTDYINFNFSDTSPAGRTITILSQLPDVSTNLVIDGATQPGTVFGISSAKVAIFFNTPIEQTLSGLRIANKHDIAILGLYIKNIADVSKASQLYFWRGIDIVNSNNIQIGQAGKGDVVTGFYNPLSTNWFNTGSVSCRNLAIKNCFFNIDADGETLPVDQEAPPDLNFAAGQIKIGGTPAEGNLLPYGMSISTGHSQDTITSYYTIKNNKIGVDYNVQTSVPTSTGILAESSNLDLNANFDIEDNVITGSAVFGQAIYAINIGGQITILRNYIGTDKTKTQTFKTGGILVYWCTGQVAIGSNSPADANYITNCNPVNIFPYTHCTVNKNSFYCTLYSQPMHNGGSNYGGPFTPPVIDILKISATSVSGTATPNSSVELFYSDKCGTCSPQTYFASTTTDANGDWVYNGPITGTVIASATLGKNTSDFTKTAIITDNAQIINACGNGTGSIKGLVPQSAANIKWIDANGKIVSTSPDLLNVKLGKYKLLAQNGECADSTSYFEIKNKFKLDTTAIARTEPSCGNSLGAISGLNVINNDPNVLSLAWQDGSGNVLGNSLSLTNVPAGAYYLVVTSADNTCSQKYGPFTLKNLTGPNIDQTKAFIQSTNCGQTVGSITNMLVTGTGTLRYSWLNDRQQLVASTKNLLNQPAGIYQLKVTDDSQCGPVYSNSIIIPETNGITLDESKVQITVASCNNNNGSVTGIQIVGATRYQWIDVNGKIISTTIDLQDAAAGDYTLTASNNYGCSRTSKSYHIGQLLPTKFPAYNVSVVSACFRAADGGVSVTTDNLVKSIRWVNSQGQTVGTDATLINASTGTYQLYLTDQNGCENYFNSYTINELPEFTVSSYGQVTNDKCNLKTGSVSASNISGGLPPYMYTWHNSDNQQIGTNSSAAGLSAGTYVLDVVDTRCGHVQITYTVTNETEDVATPSVSNLQLCSAGNGLLRVNAPSLHYNYRLYADQNSAQPLDEQKTGIFHINVTGNKIFYVSQLNGTCESTRAEVKITVGLSGINIPNAFTPNGDGVNDYWKISDMENYPDATVQVFTRYGQKVFESKGYQHPFDGTSGGKDLPIGVYYYIINLNSNCNLLSGSLTIIR